MNNSSNDGKTEIDVGFGRLEGIRVETGGIWSSMFELPIVDQLP